MQRAHLRPLLIAALGLLLPALVLPSATATTASGGSATRLVSRHFPTAASTGVPRDWKPRRTVRGDYHVRKAGAVVEDLRVLRGDLVVEAPDVTLRRVEVLGGSIDNLPGSTCGNGLVIRRSTIGRAPGEVTRGDFPAINGGGYTARRVKISGLPEGFRVGGHSLGCGPVTVVDSFARIVSPDVCTTDWHGDGLQGYDGARLTVRDSRLELHERTGCGGTAPFFYPSGQGNASVDVDGLLVEGGGFPFRLGMSGRVQDLRIVANSWGYGPISVDCPAVPTWQAHIVRLDRTGQPSTFVRRQPCDTPTGG